MVRESTSPSGETKTAPIDVSIVCESDLDLEKIIGRIWGRSSDVGPISASIRRLSAKLADNPSGLAEFLSDPSNAVRGLLASLEESGVKAADIPDRVDPRKIFQESGLTLGSVECADHDMARAFRDAQSTTEWHETRRRRGPTDVQ